MSSRIKVAMFINLMIFLLEFFAFVARVVFAGDAFSIGDNTTYYTIDSNLLAMVASAIYVIFGTKAMEEKKSIPRVVQFIRYLATSGVMYTLVVVFTVLIPAMGEGGFARMVLTPVMAIQHLVAPLLCVISFCGFETEHSMPIKWVFYATLPTGLYAFILYLLNGFYVVEGPYPFFEVHKYKVPWLVCMIFILIAMCIALNFGILKIANIFSARDTLMLNAIDRMNEEEEANKTEEERKREAEEKEKKRKKNPYLYDIIGLIVKK